MKVKCSLPVMISEETMVGFFSVLLLVIWPGGNLVGFSSQRSLKQLHQDLFRSFRVLCRYFGAKDVFQAVE